MRSLLIDRDGVINADSPGFIRSPADWQPLPGALEAIVRACRAGFRVIVVSNQSGLARGLLSIGDLNAIHARMLGDLARLGGRVEAFFFCPHGPDDHCLCRKPRDGLLLAVRERLGIDLSETVFIGDRLSDVDAARAAGARPVLVCSGLETVSAEALADRPGVPVYNDLAEAVEAMLSSS